MSKHKKQKSGGTILFGLIVAALAVVGWGAGPGGWFRPDEVKALEGVPVRRGDLRISEIARGNLEAKNSIQLVNEIEGRATILYLVEEGRRVVPGDLVVELDVSEQRDKLITQEIEVKSAEANFTKAKEQYAIQEIQNESDIAKAELDLELAQLELEKYEAQDGEWVHELAQADEAITIAKEELSQAEETLRWTKNLFDLGFAQRTELEKDELSVEKSRINLEQTRREKALKVDYENRKRTAELKAAVETAKREVEKVEKQALAKIADSEAARSSAEYELARERDQEDKLRDQIGKAKIFAPEAGLVVYHRRQSGRMGGGEVPQQGGEVHERQTIATIPRPGGMTADVSLHETKLENVRIGQRCQLNVDAIPGQVFLGRVNFLAAVADSGSWMSNPNQRIYKTEVSLDNPVPEMRPGMSCEVEIMIAELRDVLYVPRQAVFLNGDETVAFVTKADGVETRPIEVGPDNNSWVQIVSGLDEGEIVLLSPPKTWEPAPATQPAPVFEDIGEELPGTVPEAMPPGELPLQALGGSEDGPGRDGERGRNDDDDDGDDDRGGRRGEGRDGGDGQGGFGRRGFEGMTPEQQAEMRSRFESFRNMSEEERAEAIRKMREGRDQ